ncbi:hypothetical protein FOZ63_021494 [Perkinsus olseni]|uniref:3'-phosphate/5'-hydroxy nucleic acid ligase n=1 Tax=Perkinsus olseni TaxID=32597 RepID=A0A7J6QIE2_PEROL|nr:hypothetical protein FOZ62_020005 [Perkinsus olseni]KAF4708359.1 hypothetical protein FOZ63_021494 [Perkinsus olseni]
MLVCSRAILASAPPKFPRVIRPSGGTPVHLYTDDVDEQTMQQLINLSRSRMVIGYVAAMPDVHLGKGATIGSVFASRDFVCPNAVGVDIGCGMCALKVPGLTRLGISETFLVKLHGQLVQRIPTGFNSHEKASPEMREAMKRLVEEHNPTAHTRGVIGERHVRQMGTLGGGNHFIELLYDEEENIWLMLHSGSRNIGNVTAQYYDGLAARQTGTSKENLAHLAIASEAGQDYLRDMHFCQAYAMENRKFMMNSFVGAVRDLTGKVPDWSTLGPRLRENSTGQIVDNEKRSDLGMASVRLCSSMARKGQLGIIPGSMGTGSYITRGKGESMAWSSCSHGAGRKLSRNAAKRVVGVGELNEMMEGIVWDSNAAKLIRDEAPVAYKDLNEVMMNQEDLVDVVHKLKPLMNMKGY